MPRTPDVIVSDNTNYSILDQKALTDLRDLAKEQAIVGYSKLKKSDLIFRLLRAKAERENLIFGGGVLEIVQDGIGFLRSDHLLPGEEDVYVSQSQIRRFGLRTGDMVIGQVRPPKDTEKYYGLLRVEAVNGLDPEAAKLGVTSVEAVVGLPQGIRKRNSLVWVPAAIRFPLSSLPGHGSVDSRHWVHRLDRGI
jgi:transcription termination factor Rho